MNICEFTNRYLDNFVKYFKSHLNFEGNYRTILKYYPQRLLITLNKYLFENENSIFGLNADITLTIDFNNENSFNIIKIDVKLYKIIQNTKYNFTFVSHENQIIDDETFLISRIDDESVEYYLWYIMEKLCEKVDQKLIICLGESLEIVNSHKGLNNDR